MGQFSGDTGCDTGSSILSDRSETEDDTSASQSEQQVTDSSRSAQAEAAKQETEAARQAAEQAQQDAEPAEDARQMAEQMQQDAEKAAAAAESARQEIEEQVQDRMDSILAELDGDLSKAYPWVNTAEFKEDANVLIKMAEDPTGQYAAYGFLCGEYGSYGILLNDKLNGEDNWNYFYTPWAYTGTSDSEPTMEKQPTDIAEPLPSRLLRVIRQTAAYR